MAAVSFAYLKNDQLLGQHYEAAHKLSQLYQLGIYRDILMNARLLLETVVKEIFDWENLNQYYSVPDGEYRNLRNDVNYLRQHLSYPLTIFNLMDEVRRMGNDAIHDAHYQVSKGQAYHDLCDLNDIMVFLLNSYEGKNLPYLRPDLMLESTENKDQHYGRRQIKQTISKTAPDTPDNDNAAKARQLLKAKQHRRSSLGRLRHLFKH